MKLIFTLPLLLLLLTCAAFAQNTPTVNCGTEAECNAAFQKHVAAQAAEEKSAKDTVDKAAKDKADAIAKMDNKNPQPIKKDDDRQRLELLNTRRLLDQQKLETLQALVKPTIQKMMADAQASDKAYSDALTAQQKKSHAEGCAVVYDERGDIKKSEDGKEVWDCSKAGK
jgi:hypothetical protein